MATTNTATRIRKATKDSERMRKTDPDAKAEADRDAAIWGAMRRLMEKIRVAG